MTRIFCNLGSEIGSIELEKRLRNEARRRTIVLNPDNYCSTSGIGERHYVLYQFAPGARRCRIKFPLEVQNFRLAACALGSLNEFFALSRHSSKHTLLNAILKTVT